MHFLTDDLRALRKGFQDRGFDLRLVGGCVRDHLLNITPKDVDLCTDATPDEQIVIYDALGLRHIPTGIIHGTITVVLNGEPHEITSLRTESEHDGRHATMTFTRDWHDDLSRRDLTINAMVMTFDGDLIDPFGGQKDLESRRVRFVGDPVARIREDYLRILRWFRFHGRIAGYEELDAATHAAVSAEAEGLLRISRERVWMEMQKIAVGQAGDAMLEAIVSSGVNKFIGLPANWQETSIAILPQLQNPVTAFSALLGADVLGLAQEWKWSSDDVALARYLVKSAASTMSEFKYDLAVRSIPLEHVVQRALMNNTPELARNISNWEIPIFPVTGEDLVKLGMKPGPEFGIKLRQLKDVWATSDFTKSRESLIKEI